MEFYQANKENSSLRVSLSVLLSLGILLCSFLILTRDKMSYTKTAMYFILCFIFLALLVYINSVLTRFFNALVNWISSLVNSMRPKRAKSYKDSNEEYLE